MTARDAFPPGFLWGTATSAYQIEGSPLADGAGPGIWHRFSHTPGRVLDDQTGDVACDHYRRWEEDVELMVALGLNAYRFGLAWTRILPEGRGRPNSKGLDFYSRLIDRLLAHNITPMVTLYHWDLPAALDDQGGWLNRDVAEWFGDFAAVAYEAFDDRVPLWCTINEPWVIVDAGYLHGVNAPGHANLYEAPIAGHNVLRAHAIAVRRYRAMGNHAIGLVVDLEPKDPASAAAPDVTAARLEDAWKNRCFLDAVMKGGYPEDMREIFRDAWPEFPDDDFVLLAEPFDFLGINYYMRRVIEHDPAAWPTYGAPVRLPGVTYTDTGWGVHPEGLTRTLEWVKARYGNIPLYITENGAAFPDPPSAIDGRIEDPLRVDYLRDHLCAARDAIALGVDLRGYFAWSLLDNYEWASGTSKRLGLVHVDFQSQERTIKASGEFYRDVIRSKGTILHATPERDTGPTLEEREAP